MFGENPVIGFRLNDIAYDANLQMQLTTQLTELAEQNTAEVLAGKIYDSVVQFQSNLPEADDVAMSLVNFGANQTILVENIRCIGSNLVAFSGKDTSGKPLELIQHIHQLSFLLAVVQKPSPEVPRRTIGFGPL